MRSYAAVVRSELLGGERLLIAGAALGLLAWLTAWLPQAQAFEADEVRSSAALLASGVLALGAVLFLGPGLVARQLAEGRLGFYFARPVSGAALWWGKLTAALALVATAVVLVWLPALLSGARPGATLVELLGWPGTFRPAFLRSYWIDYPQVFASFPPMDWDLPEKRSLGSPLLWAAFLLVVLLLLAHTVSLALSSKSPWVAFDLAAAATVAYGGWRIADRLVSNRAEGALMTAFTVAAAGLLLGLLAAGHAAVDAGRTLHQRAHGAASVVLWSLLLAALLGTDVLSRRLLASEPEDLEAVSHFAAAPRGDWLLAGGPVPGQSGYAPLFALNPATGRQEKVDVLPRVDFAPVFSADGGAAAWMSCHGVSCRVLWLDLRAPELQPVGFDFERQNPGELLPPIALALSRDGHRLAFLEGGTLSIQAMPELDVLASVELRGRDVIGWGPQLSFRDDDTVRLANRQFNPEGFVVLDFEISTRRLRSPGDLSGWWLVLGPEAERLALRTTGGVSVYRAADLTEIYRLTAGGKRFTARPLSGGRLLLLEIPEDGKARLRLFDATGAEIWNREVDGRFTAIGNETSQGVWLGMVEPVAALEIGLDDGRILARFPDLFPSWLPAPPGSPASEILVEATGMPVRRGPDGGMEPLIALRRRP